MKNIARPNSSATCSPYFRSRYYIMNGWVLQIYINHTGDKISPILGYEEPWHTANHDRWFAMYTRNRLKNLYGLTEDEYNKVYAEQDGKCAICERKLKLVCDHNHKTGKFRALLCLRCNLVLGSLEVGHLGKYREYLRKHG